MDKTAIGLIFILAGLAYSSLALDGIYNRTLGYLVEHDWIRPPKEAKESTKTLGRKPTILLYGGALIIIGLYIIWNRKP
jgi:uncharacterized protein YjeT (DUF2065 family)